MIIISRLTFPSFYLISLDVPVSIGYLKILSIQFYLSEKSVLSSRLCCGSLLVFNVCILTMESLTAIFAKWKAVKITTKRVTRSIWRLIVIEQSPIEDKITKFFSHMLQDIETFKTRLLVLWRYIVSLTGYPFAFWIRMQLFATFVIHRANWKKEFLSILASFTLPFPLLL